MQLLQLSEATAAQRRLFFHAVDATDGITAETGLTGAGRISKNGAATAASAANISEIDSTNMPGRYYIEFSSGELDTVGILEFRFKTAACAEVVARAQVVSFDPYDAVRMGMTALPNAAAEAAGGLYTRGSGAGQINQPANGLVDVNVENWNTTAVPAENTAGYPIVTVKDGTGTGEIDTASGRVAVTEAQIDQIVDEVWDELKSAHTTADTFGDYLDDEVSSRALAGDAMALTAAAVDAVWDEATAGHTTAGTTGKALIDAGSAGDPWGTALPGAYGAGTAGKIVGDNLNATVSSRATPADVPTAAVVADAVWDEAIAGHLGAGSTGLALNSAGAAGDPWSTALPGAYGAGTAGKIVGDNVNATISSRATQTSVDDLPTNAELATALDPLPTAAENADAVWDEDATAHQTQGTFGGAIGDPGVDPNSVIEKLDSINANVNTRALLSAQGTMQTDVDDIQARLPAALVSGRIDASVGAIAANAITAASMAADASAEIADAVWDEDATGHQTQGSFGQVLGDSGADTNTIYGKVVTNLNADVGSRATAAQATAIQADTDNIQTRIPAALVSGRMDSSVGAMAADVVTAAAIAPDAIGSSELAASAVTEIQTGLSTLTAGQVNAEVVDALNVDTYAEPGQGIPAATASLVAKIGYQYKFLRNRKTQTATQLSVYADDATTVDQKATVSDNGTTFDHGEIVSGP